MISDDILLRMWYANAFEKLCDNLKGHYSKFVAFRSDRFSENSKQTIRRQRHAARTKSDWTQSYVKK